MAICTFFLRGQCKFGDNCRNEHPDAQRQGGFGSQSWSNPNRNNNTNVDSKLAFTVDVMRNDLTPQKDKPLWPLSSYAPAKHEANLLSGLDESPEELRVRAVTANQSGKGTEYVAYENGKIAAAEQAFSNARDNINQAFEQAAKQSITAPGKTAASGVFGGTSAFGAPASTSAFGNPPSTSAFGKPASAFGGTTTTPAFGNPSSASAFGSTTTPAFGNPTTSAFGKSGFGQPGFGQSAFGQTTAPGTTSAFGPPAPAGTSAFGQPSQPVSAFGQPVSAFGQPQSTQQPVSAFGQPQQPVSAFGQPAQSSLIKPASGAFGSLGASTANTFGGGAFSSFAGQPSAFGSGAPATGGSAFGQSAFGAPAPGQPTSAFGTSAAPATSAFGPSAPASSAFGAAAPATSAFATSAPATSAFGTPAPGTSAFGPAAAPTTSAFGAPSAFGALAQQPAKPAFGTSAFGTTTNTVFGPTGGTPSNAFTNPSNAVSSPFAPKTTTTPFPSTSAAPGMTSVPSEPPPLSAFPMASPSTSTAFTQPSAAAGGLPDFSKVKSLYKPGLTPYDQILPVDYMKRIPQAALEAFQSQKFEWGTVPDWIPPMEVR